MNENYSPYRSSLWRENPAPIEYGQTFRSLHCQPDSSSINIQEIRQQEILESEQRARKEYRKGIKEQNENYSPYRNRTIIEYGHNSRSLHSRPDSPINNLQEIRRQEMLESDHRTKKEYRNFEEFEMDRNTSMQRERDIDNGKSTTGYDNSFKFIPRSLHSRPDSPINNLQEIRRQEMLESDHKTKKEYRNFEELEMDRNTSMQRERDIDNGQSTTGYDNSFKLIPSYKRKNDWLMSPNNDRLMSANKYKKCSENSWNRELKSWEILHNEFDNINSIPRSSPSPADFPETSTLDSEIAEILKNDWEFEVQDFEDRVRKEYRNARDYCWKLLDTKDQKDEKFLEKVEMDPSTLIRRQKDIDYGKNTIGYSNYIKLRSTHEYEKNHLQTPNKYQKCSRRSWDGQIKRWRILLHQFDDVNSTPKCSTVDSSETFNVNHRKGRVDVEDEKEADEYNNIWH